MTDPRFAELCRYIEQDMVRLHVPGVALGIVNGPETHTAGFGVTNVENPLPVNEAALFQIGSIPHVLAQPAPG